MTGCAFDKSPRAPKRLRYWPIDVPSMTTPLVAVVLPKVVPPRR
jgi:hypothetical protein